MSVLSNREEELATLMRAAMQGDGASYRRFLETFAASLREMTRQALARAGRGESEAEDVVQDTLLALHAKRVTWGTGRPIMPWLTAIAYKKLADRLRRGAPLEGIPVEARFDLR